MWLSADIALRDMSGSFDRARARARVVPLAHERKNPESVPARSSWPEVDRLARARPACIRGRWSKSRRTFRSEFLGNPECRGIWLAPSALRRAHRHDRKPRDVATAREIQ